MNIEALRAKLAAQIKTVEHDGETYRLKKISAVDGMAIDAIAKQYEMENGQFKRPEDFVSFQAAAISKSVVDESGNKTLDSDEARELLRNLPGVIQLGNIVMDWSYPEKKTSQTTSDSPTDSAGT